MTEKTLGQKVKKARLDSRFTQQDLAGDFITRNMLSKIESGAATPSLKTLQYLAKRLDKPVSYFLDMDSEKEQYIYHDSRASFEHASFLIKNNEYEKCITYINQMLKTTDENPKNKYYGYLQYLLAKCYIKLKNYNLIDQYLDNAIEILESNLESNKDNYYLADAYFYKANMFFYKKNFDKCELYIRKSMDAFNKSYHADVLLETKLLFSLGFVLYKNGNYEQSILIMNQILDISKENRFYYCVGDANMLLGILHKKMKDLNQAIFYTKKAVSYFDAVEEFRFKADSDKNLGIFYLFVGELGSANLHLNNALKYFESVEDALNVNTIKSDLQELLVKKEDYQSAIDYSKEIEMDKLKSKDKARVYLNLGNSYIGLKDYIKAEENLKKAENLLKDSSCFDILQIIYDSYSNMYSQLEDFQKAYSYSQESKRFLELSLNE